MAPINPHWLESTLEAVIELGSSVTFEPDPNLPSMLRCTLTTGTGAQRFSVCPDRIPDAVAAALQGAMAQEHA